MSTDTNSVPGISQSENVVSDYYENYTATQKELLDIMRRKTRKTLFTIAAIIFASDFLGLSMLNAVDITTILVIAVVPLILAGLGFLSLKEPLLAIIIATLLILSIWIYTIVLTGARAAIMGWLIKAVIIYFIIA